MLYGEKSVYLQKRKHTLTIVLTVKLLRCQIMSGLAAGALVSVAAGTYCRH